jgi:hypothetical protein
LSKQYFGKLNPLAIEILSVENEFVWYGTYEGDKPGDTRTTNYDCPFPDGSESTSDTGNLIALV